MNDHKKGLKRLLNGILAERLSRHEHKDRLLRFGAELKSATCQGTKLKIVTINRRKKNTFEQALARDVRGVITVFLSRLYGSRSQKNQKLIDWVRAAIKEAQ